MTHLPPVVPSRRVRLLSITVLAVTFLVGGLVGACAVTVLRGPLVPPSGPMGLFPPPPSVTAAFRARMVRDLKLTADQADRIDAIMRRRQPEARAIMLEMRPKLQEHLEATEAEIRAVLTPEQRVRFDRMAEERRRRMSRSLGPSSTAP